MEINEKGTTALKKDILKSFDQYNNVAIISSKQQNDLSILIVIEGHTELYQITTIAGNRMKKGIPKNIAYEFYKEQLQVVIEMLKSVDIKVVIFDYNLSFWAYVNSWNLATFIIKEVNPEIVWTNAKTRLRSSQELLPNTVDTITESGIITLSLLYSYLPERLKEIDIFNSNLSDDLLEKNKENSTLLKVSFESEKILDRSKEEELEALTWALEKAKKEKNNKLVTTFESMISKKNSRN